MKFVKLLTAAYVSGSLRHPHEGVLHVDDEESQRLFGEKAAEDVTSDFDAEDNKEAPVETISAPGGNPAPSAPSEPHQSEVAPQASDDAKPSRRKAAADKE